MLTDLAGRLTALLEREPRRLPRRLERRVRSVRHLHRRPVALLRAARAAHRSAVGRRAPATRSRWSTPSPDPTAPRSPGVAPPASSPPRSPSSSPRSPSATTCATTAPARGSGAASTRSAPPPPASIPTASPTRTATATRTRTGARPGDSSSRSTCSASSRGPVRRSATRRRPTPPTRTPPTGGPTDLVRFEADRAAGVWVHTTPGRRAVIPFVGVTRSHYLPVPHDPGTFEAPVDNDQVVWAPARHQPRPARHDRRAARPARRRHRRRSPRTGTRSRSPAGGSTARRRSRSPARAPPRTPSTGGRSSWSTTSRCDDRVEGIAVVIPETARAPLQVELTASAPHATTRIVVDGLHEWATPYSGLAAVHQLDVDPTASVRLRRARHPQAARRVDRARPLVRPAAVHADRRSRAGAAGADRRAGRPYRRPRRRSSCCTCTGRNGSASTTSPCTSGSSRASASGASPSCGRRTTSRPTSSGPTCTTRSTSAGRTPPPASSTTRPGDATGCSPGTASGPTAGTR